MFNNAKDRLIAAQTDTITAQSTTITNLVMEKAKGDRKMIELERLVQRKDGRIAQLTNYLSDLNIDLSALESSQLFWGLALKLIEVNVDPSRGVNDPCFANDQQRLYVEHFARSIVKSTAGQEIA